ncbi:LSU ribosomal protein L9P [Plasticicumulans lactativorans]|uniref:Large ribosomal subunit protein bL9 n=1 Tax=Plasticicumulans lactativorans TaxID=1133106 RepID=A0A4R2KVL4_9GAMM|nr:50S ribosomal protein L9 [Plasticicumulans lactativorans]TCO76982.1 LSU ribosomal protein L9P [Plasticicumulans lactativorans]
MDIILLTKVDNLGNLGDRVKVKHGYGRNFLIPQGKATEATAANIARFEARRAELEATAATALARANERREHLADLVITMAAKAGAEGRLFGSVGPGDIADAVSSAGIELKKAEVRMPDGPIRHVGEYEVDVHLHTDVNCKLHINVIAE